MDFAPDRTMAWPGQMGELAISTTHQRNKKTGRNTAKKALEGSTGTNSKENRPSIEGE
jgi:hypothetical protein